MKKNVKKPGHHFAVNVENYLKAIWNLAQQKGDTQTPIKNSEIADYLHVKRPSVSDMLKKLQTRGYVQKNKRGTGVFLSPKGKTLVLEVLKRHRLIEVFLEKTLGLNTVEAHEEAELLEHAMSKRLVEKIDAYLDFPEQDPRGMPIPRANTKDFADRLEHTKALSEMKVGEEAKVASFSDYHLKHSQSNYELGFDLGAKITLVNRSKTKLKLKTENKKGFISLDEAQARLIHVF